MMMEIRSLSFSYPGEGFSVGPLDLSFREGEQVIVIGPNGSGKTTVLKLMAGMLSPGKGAVTILGEDISGVGMEKAAKTAGFVFQDIEAMLFSDTVSDDISFGPENIGLEGRDEDVVGLMRKMGIAHLSAKHPLFISRGEKQRVAVASILAMKPKILLMDEPTKGLDLNMKKQLIELSRSYGITLVVSSNDLEMIPLFPRMVVFFEGKIRFDGPCEDFLARLYEFPGFRESVYLRALSLAARMGWRTEMGEEKVLEMIDEGL